MSEEGYFSIFSEDNAFEEEPEERVISRELHKAERDEPSMRPTSWDEYYGQAGNPPSALFWNSKTN